MIWLRTVVRWLLGGTSSCCWVFTRRDARGHGARCEGGGVGPDQGVAEEGDSKETRVLYVQGKAKGAFTKEDIMREISLATQNADFEVCLSYLPPGRCGG